MSKSILQEVATLNAEKFNDSQLKISIQQGQDTVNDFYRQVQLNNISNQSKNEIVMNNVLEETLNNNNALSVDVKKLEIESETAEQFMIDQIASQYYTTGAMKKEYLRQDIITNDTLEQLTLKNLDYFTGPIGVPNNNAEGLFDGTYTSVHPTEATRAWMYIIDRAIKFKGNALVTLNAIGTEITIGDSQYNKTIFPGDVTITNDVTISDGLLSVTSPNDTDNAITTNGHILSTGGHLKVFTGIETSAGNIKTGAGDIHTTAGDIYTQNGTLTSTGDITSSAGNLISINGYASVKTGYITETGGFAATISGDIITKSGNIFTENGAITCTTGYITDTGGFIATTSGHFTTADGNFYTEDGDFTSDVGNLNLVQGNILLSDGKLTVNGTQQSVFQDAVEIGKKLDVLDDIVLTGIIDVQGTGTSKVAGSLNIAGNSDITGTLNVDSNTTIGGTLSSGTYTSSGAGTFAGQVKAPSFIAGTGSGIFYGVATSAQYGDVAERYSTDFDYEPGTVLSIGTSSEVTLYDPELPLAGVVSTDPAVKMFDALENSVLVALTGRIPVKTKQLTVARGMYVFPDGNNPGHCLCVLKDELPSYSIVDLIGIVIGTEVVDSQVQVKV